MLPRVHVITDLPHIAPEMIDEIVSAGVDAVQVRAKHLTDRELFEFAQDVVRTVGNRARVIVNDRLDIALAAGADGVHLGRSDVPVAQARRLAPHGFLIGATCRNAGQARQAHVDGADYVGAGPIYPSTTKSGLPAPLGLDALAEISGILPAIAISGITVDRVPEVMAAGVHGVALIAAVSRTPDPPLAARDIVTAVLAAASAQPIR